MSELKLRPPQDGNSSAPGSSLRGLGDDGARRLRCGGAAGKRQQGDIAGALDGHTQPALMAGADAGHAARKDLAALLDELRKNVGALVVDEVHLFYTKLAVFFFAEILALAAARTAGPTWATRTTRSAFTTAASGTAFAATSPEMAAFAAGSTLSAALSTGRAW